MREVQDAGHMRVACYANLAVMSSWPLGEIPLGTMNRRVDRAPHEVMRGGNVVGDAVDGEGKVSDAIEVVPRVLLVQVAEGVQSRLGLGALNLMIAPGAKEDAILHLEQPTPEIVQLQIRGEQIIPDLRDAPELNRHMRHVTHQGNEEARNSQNLIGDPLHAPMWESPSTTKATGASVATVIAASSLSEPLARLRRAWNALIGSFHSRQETPPPSRLLSVTTSWSVSRPSSRSPRLTRQALKLRWGPNAATNSRCGARGLA
jgi:hypothetical protein